MNNFITDAIDKDIAAGRFSREICTRFPPEPNGYLHIGHAKAICLSFEVAKKYGGKCNLRFDDTNPLKENSAFVEAIERDVRWLGFEPAQVRFASDYFEKFYEFALILIEKGLAYVDDSSAEEIRRSRGTLKSAGAESPMRGRSVSENLDLFRRMRDGEFAEGERVLRAKIDMASPSIHMRDPVLYRIASQPHHRTGDAWSVYPMYDFAHPLEDAIEGITHSLCTLEFEDHRPLYEWVLESLDIDEPPRQIEFARLELSGTVMSKRRLAELVSEHITDSWEDPRMPTIAGMRRRGYSPEALRKFCSEIGVAKSNSQVDFSFLEHCVREELKSEVENRNVVFNPIKVVITNYPEGESEELEIENSKENEALGKRRVSFSREIYIDGEDFLEDPPRKYFRLFPGNEVRLKGGYFIKCEDVIKNEDGSIKELLCVYDPETKSGSGKETRKVKGTIHFVDAKTAVPVKVRNYGQLYGEDGEINENSMTEERALAEGSLADARTGQRFQFFRKGYYVADDIAGERIFGGIVPLKSSWKV